MSKTCAMLDEHIGRFNGCIAGYMPQEEPLYSVLIKAMDYSLSAGGKRIRPALVYEFCTACGGEAEWADAAACAIEMIHTYSLIHDDLPCMDDDDFRRGRQSCHKVYGESFALLAGDALQALAFETIAKTDPAVLPKAVLKASAFLAKNCGVDGMVGGQVIDLSCEGRKAPIDTITTMYLLKTGALIEAAAVMGCIIGGGSKEQIAAASTFANKLGLAFQIQDDVLDNVGDAALLGKPVGSDESSEKSTYVSTLGVKRSKELVAKYTEEAKDALKIFGSKADRLIELADYLINRNK